ncbi:MAG: non-specific serine/threonine protein kinase [Halomonadaceae bacterium T82-2]|nr:MAG: non-specific serine/threonine protein kinase [Halomonadaceae bacterium T82-2]
MARDTLEQFYIPEEQSIYLLSHDDARKLKDWVALCRTQLEQLGYRDIELVGKGAYGFVFAGVSAHGERHVFKFSRITLPQHLQDRLEEEAFMLEQVDHPRVPRLVAFQRIRRQSILVMERAPGNNLEEYSLRHGRLPPRLVVHIAAQLADILRSLRREAGPHGKPVVHGDIKPSNLVFDPRTERVALIDWGSSVFAQLDARGQFVSNSVMELMSGDLQHTNARLGDVYFIGDEQLNGGLSSPRFDEQGVAATLYALASAQSCRFGRRAIPATSLGLPVEFARVLDGMLDADPQHRRRAGDYFLAAMPRLARLVMVDLPEPAESAQIPVWTRSGRGEIDTVVYSSRKAFLREAVATDTLRAVNDVQLDRYYRTFMQGMGETEKAFLAAVSRLGKYPVVGGLAVRWASDGVYIDSVLDLHDPSLKRAFVAAVNNMVTLARAIYRRGIFKSCLFNARDTRHIDRTDPEAPFRPPAGMTLPYEVSAVPLIRGLGVSGYMKMPYKDTRSFSHIERLPARFYPRNPREAARAGFGAA